ncbi:hypothetical protein [Arthrobacter sp. EPSL27]|uniref:hypothetical protein n=1 Tax=Arthrobacter sp. EPSL27 TaxID=1745378 RepID=UPI00074AB9DD|nr:hypothetical protein [Arthrobacter sp. EPSL27]KUM41092.1 hypothetical protein AR539_00115 [Arthrobacter sp. EPSL27]
MTKSKIVVRRTKGSKRRPPRKLPVSVASLRWALVRRLLVAVPAGLFLGGMVATASGLESADAATEAALLYGLAFSITLFLAVTWLLGRHRRAAFAAAGGDPHAAGVLLFGVLTPRRRNPGQRGHGHGGDGGYSAGGDSSGDCGGRDGGGGGCD